MDGYEGPYICVDLSIKEGDYAKSAIDVPKPMAPPSLPPPPQLQPLVRYQGHNVSTKKLVSKKEFYLYFCHCLIITLIEKCDINKV